MLFRKKKGRRNSFMISSVDIRVNSKYNNTLDDMVPTLSIIIQQLFIIRKLEGRIDFFFCVLLP